MTVPTPIFSLGPVSRHEKTEPSVGYDTYEVGCDPCDVSGESKHIGEWTQGQSKCQTRKWRKLHLSSFSWNLFNGNGYQIWSSGGKEGCIRVYGGRTRLPRILGSSLDVSGRYDRCLCGHGDTILTTWVCTPRRSHGERVGIEPRV